MSFALLSPTTLLSMRTCALIAIVKVFSFPSARRTDLLPFRSTVYSGLDRAACRHAVLPRLQELDVHIQSVADDLGLGFAGSTRQLLERLLLFRLDKHLLADHRHIIICSLSPRTRTPSPCLARRSRG